MQTTMLIVNTLGVAASLAVVASGRGDLLVGICLCLNASGLTYWVLR